MVAGSLGGPDEPGNAAAFFGPGIDLVAVPYDDAVRAPDPLLASPPMHPSYEDRPGAPDRVIAGLDDRVARHLTDEWVRILGAPGVLDGRGAGAPPPPDAHPRGARAAAAGASDRHPPPRHRAPHAGGGRPRRLLAARGGVAAAHAPVGPGLGAGDRVVGAVADRRRAAAGCRSPAHDRRPQRGGSHPLHRAARGAGRARDALSRVALRGAPRVVARAAAARRGALLAARDRAPRRSGERGAAVRRPLHRRQARGPAGARPRARPPGAGPAAAPHLRGRRAGRVGGRAPGARPPRARRGGTRSSSPAGARTPSWPGSWPAST